MFSYLVLHVSHHGVSSLVDELFLVTDLHHGVRIRAAAGADLPGAAVVDGLWAGAFTLAEDLVDWNVQGREEVCIRERIISVPGTSALKIN